MKRLKLCPLCNSEPKDHVSREGRGRQSHTVYGFTCSNPDCNWSYACTVYSSREEAIKEWNKKVEFKEQLIEWSGHLHPCSCGGKANLVYENYGRGCGMWLVRCAKCQKLLGVEQAMDAIISAWNRRNASGIDVDRENGADAH